MRMKLGKYFSVAIGTIVVYLISLIFLLAIRSKEPIERIHNILALVAIIILTIFFISNSIGTFWYSLKLTLKFYKQKNIWKILSLAFGVGMTIFSLIILGMSISWIIGTLTELVSGGQIFDKAWATFVMSTSHLSSVSQNFNYYIVLLTFILGWCGAGIAFEIIKKILGGNKIKYTNTTTIQ